MAVFTVRDEYYINLERVYLVDGVEVGRQNSADYFWYDESGGEPTEEELEDFFAGYEGDE